MCSTFSKYIYYSCIKSSNLSAIVPFILFFADFLKPLFIIKYKHCGVFPYSEIFYMDCIVNKYIFFNLYVHSHLKYTHLIKSSLKYI